MASAQDLYDKARRYAALLDASINNLEEWEESIGVLLKEIALMEVAPENVEDFLGNLCKAYEKEFIRLKISY